MRSIPSKAPAWAFVSLFLLSVASPVTADSLESPTDFTASPSNGGVILSWGPPEGEDPDGYKVYLDGALAATPVDTSVWVPAATSYAVTAAYGDGSESMAAVIMGPSAGSSCTPITISTTQPPFIFPRVHTDCLDPVWWLIDEILRADFSPSLL